MKKLLIILFLCLGLSAFGQTNGILSWTNQLPPASAVDIYKATNILGPWPLYLVTNNPVTNAVTVPLTPPRGFFAGKYASTNYVYTTNNTLVTNTVVSTNVTYTTNGSSSVTVAWNFDSNQNIVGHKVYYGAQSATYTNSVNAFNSTNATITNLQPSTYYIAATAMDNLGQESDFSTEISYSAQAASVTTNYTYVTNRVVATNSVISTNSTTSIAGLRLKLTPIPLPFTPSFKTNTYNFTNVNLTTIRDNTTASPYPSTTVVSGVTGTVDKVTVTLLGLTHTWSGDIDIMLSSPSNQTVLVMSDCGYGSKLTNAVMAFDDIAASMLNSNGVPNLVSGTYKPSNYTESWSPNDLFPAPAPSVVNTNKLAIFNNKNPNGVWSLWVLDDGPNDSGSLGKWVISIRAYR
jgi:subtilisin-like proprotein convertase family protein